MRALRACEVSHVRRRRPAPLRPVEGTEFELPCELVLLALGFSGPEPALAEAFGVSLEPRVAPSPGRRPTRPTCPGVFVCGDAGRGQSLIVWAIAEGRSAAAAVDRHLCRRDPPAGARCRDRLRAPARAGVGQLHSDRRPDGLLIESRVIRDILTSRIESRRRARGASRVCRHVPALPTSCTWPARYRESCERDGEAPDPDDEAGRAGTRSRRRTAR